MKNNRQLRVILTGVAGQDGSYLAEYLIKRGYFVYGVSRRKSVNQGHENIEHLIDNDSFQLLEGDITDSTFISRIIHDIKPHEYYNLASQSHVGYSFKDPLDTFRVTGEAVIMQLEMIRYYSPATRFYQASTSELFGGLDCPKSGYNENTPFHPRSPYAVAKAAAFYAVQNYREAYGLHASNGILFNHSCISKETSLYIRNNGLLKIINPTDLLSPSSLEIGRDLSEENLEIWDGESWVKLKSITVKPVEKNDAELIGQITNTRSGVVLTTKNHNLLNKDKKKIRADSVSVGDELLHGELPTSKIDVDELTNEEAELIGLVVGDGWVHKEKMICHIGNNSDQICERIAQLWNKINSSDVTIGKLYKKKGSRGKSRLVKLNNFSKWHFASFLRNMIYNKQEKKVVPVNILNGSKEVQLAFLKGYNQADGLKKNKCTYEFKNFKTNSQELASGLIYLISNATNQSYNLTAEKRDDFIYYSINLLSDKMTSSEKKSVVKGLLLDKLSQREISIRTGISRTFIRKVYNNEEIKTKHYKYSNRTEVKKILNTEYECVYDIETASGKFMAGAGNIVIANSPRRGHDFATRKMTRGVARIKLGLQDALKMGNLEAVRDEGHAYDYVRAMHLMLLQDKPDDYVIATGKSASIRQMLEHICNIAGLKIEDVYEMDQRFMRPSDVPFLLGDATKAREILGWTPEYDWKKLLTEMYQNDYAEISSDEE